MPEAMPLQPEQSFAQGRFVLVQRLGRGGMGEVWLARDQRLQEQVALKFLPLEIRGDPGALDDLRRETARSHKLTHPNIVRIHDLHEDPDGTAFIVMEYIDGPTLSALRLQQPSRVLSWDYLRPLVQQLCAALEYAHGEKVIHRDLKPANIMVDSRGRLKMADFGIAAMVSDSMSRVSLKNSTSGTLPYMSPQQLTGKRPQAADDIYALGATLYELASSKPPFHSGDITHQVLHEPPEPIEERLAGLGIQNEIPRDAAALIMACLAKEPGQRPPSAQAAAEWIGLELAAKPSTESLAAALFPEAQPAPAAAVEDQPPGPASPAPARWGWKLAAAGIVALVMAGAFWLWKGSRPGGPSNAPVSEMNTAPLVASPEVSTEPNAKVAAMAETTPAQAKLKQKWHNAFQEARRDLINNNDQPSADFAAEILAALEKPAGMSPGALAVQSDRVAAKVRELVRAGSLESAATLNWDLWQARFEPGHGKTGPAGAANPAANGSATRPDGLVLYLSCDEPPDQGVVRDESGAGNEGRVYGATWVSEGRFGGAYRFHLTNIDDRIVIPNSVSLNPPFITVAAWIKSADSDGFYNRILDKDWRNGYCLSLGGDWKGQAARGKLLFETSSGEIESDHRLGDDRWHHVAATFDGHAVRLYIDGLERTKMLKNAKPLTKNTWDLCIGNSLVDYGTGELNAYDGLIDEVRIYNRVLSAGEIKALATANRAGADIPPMAR